MSQPTPTPGAAIPELDELIRRYKYLREHVDEGPATVMLLVDSMRRGLPMLSEPGVFLQYTCNAIRMGLYGAGAPEQANLLRDLHLQISQRYVSSDPMAGMVSANAEPLK